MADAHYNEWNARAGVPAAFQSDVVRNRIVYKWGEVQMRVGLKGALLMDEALATLFQKMTISKSATSGMGSGPQKHFLGGVLDAEIVARG